MENKCSLPCSSYIKPPFYPKEKKKKNYTFFFFFQN